MKMNKGPPFTTRTQGGDIDEPCNDKTHFAITSVFK